MRGLAQVVAGGGQETRLGLVGGLGRGLGLLHLALRLVQFGPARRQFGQQAGLLRAPGTQAAQGPVHQPQGQRRDSDQRGNGHRSGTRGGVRLPQPGGQQHKSCSGNGQSRPLLADADEHDDAGQRDHRAHHPSGQTVRQCFRRHRAAPVRPVGAHAWHCGGAPLTPGAWALCSRHRPSDRTADRRAGASQCLPATKPRPAVCQNRRGLSSCPPRCRPRR